VGVQATIILLKPNKQTYGVILTSHRYSHAIFTTSYSSQGNIMYINPLHACQRADFW